MCEFLFWDIIAASAGRGAEALPAGIISIAPPFSHPELPPEAAILLPGGDTNLAMLSMVEAAPEQHEGRAVGLFLSDPFLNVELAIRQLHAAGVVWVAAFPSACQHEGVFRQYLAEVDLELARELRVLDALSEAGLATIASVSSAADASVAASGRATALLILPDLGKIVGGYPDLATRTELEHSVRRELAAGVPPVLLGLRKAEEPVEGSIIDGAVLRPRLSRT